MANDIPNDWSDEQRSGYARYLEFQLTDGEATRLNEVAGQFMAAMTEAFGPRAEIALVNLTSSILSHMLLNARDGLNVYNTVNDWLDVAHRRHGGRPFNLAYGMPFMEPNAYDEHAEERWRRGRG